MDTINLLNKTVDIFPIVAANMRRLRESFGWNRSRLAHQLGWSVHQLTGYELGIMEPKISELLHFARFFNAIPEDIIGKKSMNYQRIPYLTTYNTMQKSDPTPTSLSQMVTQTEDIQKILDGFRAFYELQVEQQPVTESEQWHSRFRESLDLLEEYVELNQRIINSVC